MSLPTPTPTCIRKKATLKSTSLLHSIYCITTLSTLYCLDRILTSKAMAILWKIVTALVLLSSVKARPFDVENVDQSESVPDDKVNGPTTSEPEEPANLYSINADAADQSEDVEAESPLQKRSAEEVDDLETAAGTNVLRPLFVYRQQLALRERVKKGAIRRPGIRPRF